ncbi:3-deoxy-D-manno-octulosonic acid transferase [Magnetospira thiophila]
MMLSLYRWATSLLGPLIYGHLVRRRRRGKEDAARFGERLGRAGRPRPEGPLVWIHAASVGESLSVLPLIDALLAYRPDLHILLTTGTVTSAQLLAQRLPARAIHQYVPVDRLVWVERFLDHWRPDLALWAESEFWPNLVDRAERRGVPMILVNGRVSDRSFERWQHFPASIAQLLGGFDLCLGQTVIDESRLRTLGAPRTACVGNLKYASPPLPVATVELDHLRGQMAGRPLWLAASTHAGEEAVAGRCHQALSERHSKLLTIIVPRHPGRGDEIAAALSALGLNLARRAAGQPLTPDTDIYLADTIGELGLFFRLCPLVFMGKSLIGRGGQNPLEAARLGCALLVGPQMDNFVAVTDDLVSGGGCLMVQDEAHLRATLDRLLAQPEQVIAMGDAARREAESKASVLPALMTRLDPYLRNLRGENHAAP